MAAGLTYRELVREVGRLTGEVRRDTAAFRALAQAQKEQAADTRRISEQIAALHVDEATVAETSEVSKIMQGLSDAALAYESAAEEAGRAAADAGAQAATDHDGIQQAADSAPVPMADRTWYTQE
ncbi:hypothetical protein ACFVVX_26780 [Kitasatospora sp. NPDC058170]|uniref:hypothetical protein n=1 Tax=Kitasatospora sp. NPDC058170 TaxID=3346364 RepID=UPI0036DE2FAB